MGSHSRAAPQLAASVMVMTSRTSSLHLRLLVLVAVLAHTMEASCKFEGKQICEGAVTKELSTVVKICQNGKLKLKKKSDIAPGWPKAGGECVWYGDIICDGAVVQDLYRWWFLMKCSKGKMSLYSRSWTEVTNDRRYKKVHNSGGL